MMTKTTGLARRAPPRVPEKDLAALLMPTDADKDTKSRIAMFLTYHDAQGLPWYRPDLAGWCAAMLAAGLHPSTIMGRLSTVRSRYTRLITDNGTRHELLAATPADWAFSDRAAFVNEVLTQLENDLDPKAVRVKVETVQDRTDAAHLRLTKAQADALLDAPGVTSLRGLRDTAMLALMLCTGIREAELVALDVEDLRAQFGGELALHVRMGKGSKTRLVPYGELSWALTIVEKWLAVAGITEGAVFRSFWKGARRLRPGRLSLRAVQLIVTGYKVAIDGEIVSPRPHDLRRTYARRLYDAGLPLVAIQQNLGHSSVQTTLGYVGELDAAARRAPAVYSYDLTTLDNLIV